jgi:hypothetical protein
MLFSTSSNTLAEIGSVSSDTFSSILPFLYLIIGVLLAFFIVAMIIDTLQWNKLEEKVERELKRSNELLTKK